MQMRPVPLRGKDNDETRGTVAERNASLGALHLHASGLGGVDGVARWNNSVLSRKARLLCGLSR